MRNASHTHSLAYLRKTPDEVVAEIARIRAARDAEFSSTGLKTLIENGAGTALGSTIQGEMNNADALRQMQALLDAGADRVNVADTVGYADPHTVSVLVEQALKIAGDKLWCAHYDDARYAWPCAGQRPRCRAAGRCAP